ATWPGRCRSPTRCRNCSGWPRPLTLARWCTSSRSRPNSLDHARGWPLMGNLTARTPGSSDPRPFQVGSIEGSKGGVPVASKLWLVDTGGMVSAITKDNADRFDLQPIGASAVATTGGGMIIKTALTMVFTVRDRFGVDREVRCSLPIAVKPNNQGS